jgi:hypothetical protein
MDPVRVKPEVLIATGQFRSLVAVSRSDCSSVPDGVRRTPLTRNPGLERRTVRGLRAVMVKDPSVEGRTARDALRRPRDKYRDGHEGRSPVGRRIAFRAALAGGCGAFAYLRFIRPWQLGWGASDDEVREPLRGDEEVPSPTVQATRAITIGAPPKDVWPWIAQIGYVGYERAGYYAFDFWDADAGRERSSWRLIPEAQELHVGLRIGEEGFTVRSFEPGEHLVLAYHYPRVEWVVKDGVWPKFGDCSWAFILRQAEDGCTRLVVRTRVTLGGIGLHLLWWPLFEVGDFLQQWRMLPGIKRRAERFVQDPHRRRAGVGDLQQLPPA